MPEPVEQHGTAAPTHDDAIQTEFMPEEFVTEGEALRAEVADLADVITRARQEISALEEHGVKGRHIPAATDELDAIVAHTAAATDAILEACECLDDTARKLGPPGGDAVQASTARIYEACSFQDIVGQRISKVVATLRMIDTKVAHLKGMLDDRTARGRTSDPLHGEAQTYEQQVLLNGPQLVAAAMAQSEVDRLLADMA